MTYQSEVLADSPLAYYRLGESSGTTMTDASGNGRAGTYNGTFTLGAPGLLVGDTDTAVTFNAGVGIVPFGAWMNTDYITAEAIIKPSALAGAQEIVCHDNNGSAGEQAWRIRLNGTKVEYLHWTSSGLFINAGTTTLTAGSTYHIAMTFNGAQLVGYVNGAVDFSGSRTGVTSKPTTPFGVGAMAANSTLESFHGVIDEVAFYGTALSATRIQAHYTAATTADTSRSISLAATAPAATAVLTSNYVAPPNDVSLGGTAPAAVGSFTLIAPVPVDLSLSGTAPTAAAQFDATFAAMIDTSATYSNDGYNYDGTAEVTYDPPVTPDPPHIHRTPVRRVHQSLPAPTLVDGRPT